MHQNSVSIAAFFFSKLPCICYSIWSYTREVHVAAAQITLLRKQPEIHKKLQNGIQQLQLLEKKARNKRVHF